MVGVVFDNGLCVVVVDSSVICMFVGIVALQKVVRNHSHINPIAEELSQRFIVDGYEIKDKVDVVLLSRIIEGVSRNIASNDKVELAATTHLCSVFCIR